MWLAHTCCLLHSGNILTVPGTELINAPDNGLPQTESMGCIGNTIAWCIRKIMNGDRTGFTKNSFKKNYRSPVQQSEILFDAGIKSYFLIIECVCPMF